MEKKRFFSSWRKYAFFQLYLVSYIFKNRSVALPSLKSARPSTSGGGGGGYFLGGKEREKGGGGEGEDEPIHVSDL